MSITGPGCPACDYRGYLTHEGSRIASHPCGACSPWSHGDDFPDAALRALALDVLAGTSTLAGNPCMVTWARGLLEYAAEVDADRARLAVTTCAPARGRCGW